MNEFKVNIKNISFSRSKVDIIIPVHNYSIINLVYSIINSVRSNPYKITIIDDFSNNKINYFDNFDKERPTGVEPMIQTIRSETQKGFAASLNIGIQNTKNPWILCMHSDCIIENKNFMIELGKSLMENKDNNIRLFSSMTNNLDPKYNELIGEKSKIYNDKISEKPIPLFCFMFHRELLNKIGMFKEYPYVGFENEELFYRMKFHGYKMGICGRSWIHHENHGTTKLLIKNKTIKEEMLKNRERCVNDLKKIFSS